MKKILFYFKNLLNNFLNSFKSNSYILSSSQVESFINKITSTGLIKKLEISLKNELNMDRKNNSTIDKFYGERLGDEQSIYNFPLKSKLSENHTIELVKSFFIQIHPEFSLKANSILDGTSDFNFIFENNKSSRDSELNLETKEIYCVKRGDLRDLYSIIHEITHTFDTKNGDTDARRIFGEISSQCMERLLDEFLLNLNDMDLQKYGFDKNTLMQDIHNRQLSTFLSRKDNILNFNTDMSNKEINLRYILAQLYSTKFMDLDRNIRSNELANFIKKIENNNIESCSKSFGIDLNNIFSTIELPLVPKIINDIKEKFNQVELFNQDNNILSKPKSNKYINLISKSNKLNEIEK